MDSFVKCRAQQLIEMKIVPQENPRLEMSQAFLEGAIEGRRDSVHTSYAEFGFHLDQTGISECEDCTEKRVAVPSAIRGQALFHPIHRNLKYRLVVSCISAAEEHAMPLSVC
jgi:hypothetical protein